MLIEHLDGLVAYIKHKITNAYAESINGMIQLLKANARGYRRFENFRIAILFHFGRLNLYPHKSPSSHNLKVVVSENGALDMAGNLFDADPSTDERESTIRYKLKIDNEGNVTVLEEEFE